MSEIGGPVNYDQTEEVAEVWKQMKEYQMMRNSYH